MEVNKNSINNDPFYNFLSKLSDKIKDSKVFREENFVSQVIVDVESIEQKEKKVYSDFLQKFSNIIDKEKGKKIQAIKESTIKYIESLKDDIHAIENNRHKKEDNIEEGPVSDVLVEEIKNTNKVEDVFLQKVSGVSEEFDKLEDNEVEDSSYLEVLKSIEKVKVSEGEEVPDYIKKFLVEEIARAKAQILKYSMESGGGSVAAQYANGGTMTGDLNVTGRYLSAGKDILDIFSKFDTSIINLSGIGAIGMQGATGLTGLQGATGANGLNGATGFFDTGVLVLSSNWENTLAVVQANSGNWSNTYNVVQSNSAAWGSNIKRFDYVEGSFINFTYSGIASYGTAEADNNWTIRRIAYTTTSSVSNLKVAYNTSWHGRLTASYT